MKLINWDEIPDIARNHDHWTALTEGRKTALTIGVFDGLHRGHQALLTKITDKAPLFLPTVVTFRENPKKFAFLHNTKGESEKKPEKLPSGTSRKDNTIKDIICFEEKMELLQSLGIELCVIIDFSAYFSKISGRAFLEALNLRLCPAYIGLGMNFHCGYQRDTDAEAFKALAEGLGIKAEIVPPVMEGGLPISSSRIRKALQSLDYKEAALLLGRPLNYFQNPCFGNNS